MAGYGSLPAQLEYRRVTTQHASDEDLEQRDDREAREELGRRLAAAGRESELRSLADRGDEAARWHLTLMLEKQDRIAEAIDVLGSEALTAATA